MASNIETFKQGKQLKFAREYRGLSQTELSKKIKGLSQSNLSNFEKGLVDISENVKKDIMTSLDFPFEFLNKRVCNIEILG